MDEIKTSESNTPSEQPIQPSESASANKEAEANAVSSSDQAPAEKPAPAEEALGAPSAPDAAPVATAEPTADIQPTPGMNNRGSGAKIAWTLIALIAVAAAGSGGFAAGRKTAPKPKPAPVAATPVATGLTVPQNATIIAQCAKNRGTQYVLPKDIPLGPVYNVYNNKVIGVEYMVGKDDLLGGKSYLNLPLNNQTFDHVNIGLLSTGHAGYPAPHYHIDLMTVPTSVTDKITC